MKTWAVAALAASLISGVISGNVAEPRSRCRIACPVGYFCDTIRGDCSRTDNSPNKLLRRQERDYTPVTGPVEGGVVNRLPLQVLQTEEPDVFNMFMLGLFALQRVSETDSLSYYQLAGIHGRPHIPWGEPASPTQDPDYGYCSHSSALFGTWHRPYLTIIEQRLSAHAIDEASKFRGSEAARWQSAARNVRLPYWDWSSEDLRSAIPQIMMEETVSITIPSINGTAIQQTIQNPLYQYTFTDSDLKSRYFEGFALQAPSTLRQSADTTSSRNEIADSNMRAGYGSRRQNTYNLFSIPTFREFSSTSFSAGGRPNAWTSIEAIHNQIHSSIGGQGHMTLIEYSAFDPIFWVHHANVDRLTAMYQAIYPGEVVTPQPATPVFARQVQMGDMDTIDTPLWPFRKADGDYFTSRDVSSAGSIWSYGYGYPEVPASYRNRPTSDLRTFTVGRVNALYGRVSESRKREQKTVRREWLCHFVFSPSQVGGPAELDIFLGNNTDGNPGFFVGSGSTLGKSYYTQKDKDMDMLITAVVPLTAAIEEEGIDTSDIVAVVRYLYHNLRWEMQNGDGVLYDLSDITSLKVGVSSSEVVCGGPDELPSWGEFETYYEITGKKKRGMSVNDSALVGSTDAPTYLEDLVDDLLEEEGGQNEEEY